MFDFIKGQIITLFPTTVVLENSGIGYLIQITTQTYSRLEGKDEVRLYLHQILREDVNDLYGFIESDERFLFRQLISVSGVGPSTARMILSAFDSYELRDLINTGQDSEIRKVKGIGLKTAQRIIVDLQGKLGEVTGSPMLTTPVYNTVKQEALSALVALGFAKGPSEKLLDKLVTSGEAQSVEQLIKQALKQL